MNRMRNAECGVRNVKGSIVSANDLPLQFRIPHSALPIWGEGRT